MAAPKHCPQAGTASGLIAAFLTLAVWTASAHADSLTITPTFDSSITSSPNAGAIENTINSAIQYYESNITTAHPVDVQVAFRALTGSSGGMNYSTYYFVPYSEYHQALINASSGNATDTAALAGLPGGPNNPVTGDPTMMVKSANGRALGLNTPGVFAANGTFGGGKYDGVVSLDLHSPALFMIAQHEINEVLGLGSNVNGGSLASHPLPQDLFRYGANGSRSYTTDPSARAFFSLDGKTPLAEFNNQTSYLDYGDWRSHPLPPGTPPRVQDAYGLTAGPTMANDGGVEALALDAIGYNLASAATAATAPEPASLSLAGLAALALAGGAWRRKLLLGEAA